MESHTATRFLAKAADGREIWINHLRKFVETETRGQTYRAEAQAELQTDDGRHLNHRGQGRYELLDGIAKVQLTSDDPAAP